MSSSFLATCAEREREGGGRGGREGRGGGRRGRGRRGRGREGGDRRREEDPLKARGGGGGGLGEEVRNVCLTSLGVLSRSSAILLFLAGSSELYCSHRSPSNTHWREGGERE